MSQQTPRNDEVVKSFESLPLFSVTAWKWIQGEFWALCEPHGEKMSKITHWYGRNDEIQEKWPKMLISPRILALSSLKNANQPFLRYKYSNPS